MATHEAFDLLTLPYRRMRMLKSLSTVEMVREFATYWEAKIGRIQLHLIATCECEFCNTRCIARVDAPIGEERDATMKAPLEPMW